MYSVLVMNRRSSASFFILLISLVSFISSVAEGDGNVGCLFQDVCIENIEWCYSDGAFGRCVQLTPAKDDLYRFNLDYNDLEKLKTILQNLLINGFGWKNSYAQCLIQAQLYAIRLGTEFNEQTCSHLMLQHYEDPIRQLKELERLHPEGPAGFHVSERLKLDDDNGPEKYNSVDKWPDYNIRSKEQPSYNSFGKSKKGWIENDLPSQLVALPLSNENYKKRKKSSSDFETHSRFRGTPLYMPKHRLTAAKGYGDDEPLISSDDRDKQKTYFDSGDAEPRNLNRQNAYKLNTLIGRMNDLFKPAATYTEGGPLYLDNADNDRRFDGNLYERLMDDYDSDLWGFRRSERLDVKKPGPYFKVNNYAFQNMNRDLTAAVDGNIDSMKKSYDLQSGNREQDVIEDLYHPPSNGGTGLTNFKNQEYAYVPGTSNKGGSFTPELAYVFVKTKHGVSNKSATDILNIISSELHIPRDVLADAKWNGNELLFKVVPNTYGVSAYGVKRGIDDIKHILRETMDIHVIFTDTGNKSNFNLYEGKKNISDDYNETDEKYYNNQLLLDDMKIVYILLLKDTMPNWNSANYILRRIENFLNVDRETLKLLNVYGNEVSFLVDSEEPRLNGANLSKSIDPIKDYLRKENINIQSVEAIDIPVKDDVHANQLIQNPRGMLYALAISVCVLLGAAFVSFIALCFVRRHARTRDKLKKSPGGTTDPEHSKSYQLCRARMAGKPPELSHVGHRITSISRESDNSPSSRSSTSSWSEEPMTNMDITTGHMVLSYMEDHLKNKGRLDSEWAALCVYEAEPCSVAVAQLSENLRKNRYVNALPYDHARVLLTALSNVSGSDYINASTITDHDPRNPAYIATQGPLPTTTIDFWQMIWEQGCVVIVMLTRLVENDVSMCHRYWPQEGSDLYNIYEVHLVSEHIWCDDFLVRSFYLKNLKTTETRTVTQFHFLTWPEGGVPPAIRPLLEFRRKVNKSFRGRSCPIIVHCSDGVGRTGTYLLLDMVLNRISKGAKEIDIAATLEHIRDQRAGAVSTKSQFQFVLSAVAEEVDAVLRAFPQQSQDQAVTIAGGVASNSGSSGQQSGFTPSGQQSSATTSAHHDDSTSTSQGISRIVIEEEPPITVVATVTTITTSPNAEQAKEGKDAIDQSK